MSAGQAANDPDLITLLARAGKGIGKIFTRKSSEASAPTVTSNHDFSYGVVYANAPAAAELARPTRSFPVGSILVRERLDSKTSEVPSIVIAMVKRSPGFSKETGDWEFFTLTGTDLQLLSRQTTGRCAECHTKAQKTDWVFIDQLKN